MRLVAAFGVFQFHLWQNYLGVTLAFPATDYFLVLVGVLAAMTQADRIGKGSWRGYMQARYIRMYVTYLPLFLLALAFKWQGDWGWMRQSFFFIPLADRTPVIGATWMLSHFILFYFLFSLAYLFKKESSLWGVFSVWALGVVAFNFFGWKPAMPHHWAQMLFYERNLEFIFGYLAGLILRQGRLPIQWARRVFGLGAVGIGISILLQNNGISPLGRSLYSGIPVTLFVLGLVAMEKQGAPDRVVKILTWPWLVLAGESSYVLYLSHGILLQAWDRLLGITASLVPFISAGIIAFAVLGYVYWESPMIAFLNKGQWIRPKLPVWGSRNEEKAWGTQ
ncbi:MAG: acyltransferase [Anaerolineales bacterium]|nr:acyltransferase [Anaerolineales bacterium]